MSSATATSTTCASRASSPTAASPANAKVVGASGSALWELQKHLVSATLYYPGDASFATYVTPNTGDLHDIPQQADSYATSATLQILERSTASLSGVPAIFESNGALDRKQDLNTHQLLRESGLTRSATPTTIADVISSPYPTQ
ncbi:hypothetical protein CONLIGDRAFT_685804 [Coniochaeta ligniaria NRRL 30616]|uniref:Uncharacterized protein n=1 Tax=Coniochaeta ligniaria NRRL 30616 TaxID=1408157 RepID=A0A1J7ISV4_9PEZI|nr:hypothetical protein CONLIGDRAFT_685804 [Coniochaeta ligniaria NRRL 30616]